jgi:two-component system sensor histidine kinase EvgS
VPTFLQTDGTRIQQVAYNLVDNAIKFNEPGTKIDVECYYHPQEEVFAITVRDSGKRISDAEAKLLFKPYTTLQAAQNAGTAGAGMGLYMCKRICEALKGQIIL